MAVNSEIGADGLETRRVSLRELIEAMAHVPDDEIFRWFQGSTLGGEGTTQATVTYCVTMKDARTAVGL